MLQAITDYFYKRKLKQLHKNPSQASDETFARALNTIREGKYIIKAKEDGIYIRLASNDPDHLFTLDWACVYKRKDGEYYEKEGKILL